MPYMHQRIPRLFQDLHELLLVALLPMHQEEQTRNPYNNRMQNKMLHLTHLARCLLF